MDVASINCPVVYVTSHLNGARLGYRKPKPGQCRVRPCTQCLVKQPCACAPPGREAAPPGLEAAVLQTGRADGAALPGEGRRAARQTGSRHRRRELVRAGGQQPDLRSRRGAGDCWQVPSGDAAIHQVRGVRE